MKKQPDPIKNDSVPVADQVVNDILKRKEAGLATYGVFLQAFNGRKALQDAYEEVLDMACYLKQKLIEEDYKCDYCVNHKCGDYGDYK